MSFSILRIEEEFGIEVDLEELGEMARRS